MTVKKPSAKAVEKAAEEFRNQRLNARTNMNAEIAKIKEDLRQSSRNAQVSVRDIWIQYRTEKFSYRETMDKVGEIWDAHAQHKIKAAADIAAAKARYKEIMSRKFEYAD